MAHFYIAAAHKSSGKTSVSIGLTAALVKRGLSVQPFKKGPDYIDPLWLERAAGRACYNLDFFTMSHAEILATFVGRAATADISLIEGNKGLFDGVDVEGSDSNAALAKMLCTPVVLVIDTTGMTRGIAPLINGYLDFDRDVDVRGVILNKVGGARHEGKLRAALERYTDTEVLGAIGRDQALEIPERHLGLVPANEDDSADATIVRIADAMSAGVNIDRLIEIADSSEMPLTGIVSTTTSAKLTADVRIAIARDAAFGFYYQDDLEAFAANGAELIPFDTLNDPKLPEADGLFIGGGFPETHLAALSANQSLRAEIRQALAKGMPAYAECGGLMYLSRSIQWRDQKYDMVGAVPGDTIVDARPQGRGYVLIEETGKSSWPPAPHGPGGSSAGIPAHEFHYARLRNLSDGLDFAYRVIRGNGIDGHHDGLLVDNLLAGFTHRRNTEGDPWVNRWVEFVRGKSVAGRVARLR
ncbi:MAG: hydrogenobyrinic acid a,c-diamide synthase (glutamine-hydrolyzing) [Desulfobulbaceae bacterium]|nr:hydrogenobyrinic acid a,c-diamide synthase (glutamine-hydrolyzing) [Desulfobulbaceae bacterium]